MYSNWALRSGCCVPSTVFVAACSEYPSSCSRCERLVAHRVARLREHRGQVACTLRRPPQGRHRIAARRRLDEPLQRDANRGVHLPQRPTTPAGTPDTSRGQGRAAQFLQSLVDRRPRQSRTPRDGRHPTASELRRVRCSDQAPLALVQMLEQRSVLRRERTLDVHTPTVASSSRSVNVIS